MSGTDEAREQIAVTAGTIIGHELGLSRAAMSTGYRIADVVLPIVQQAQREAVEAALGEVVPLLDELADPNPCWFDHHGGCQEHGFLDLTPGDVCPNEAAQRLIRAARERAGAS